MFLPADQANSRILDATTEYSPQNLLQALVQINLRLGMIEQQGQIGLAQTVNSRVISKNKYLWGQALEPLQKVVSRSSSSTPGHSNVGCFQVPGYGRNRALPFILVLNAAGQNTFHDEFPPDPIPDDIGTIGETPPDFQPKLDDYGHIDILRMIVFYNETFGILPQDNLGDRTDKFRRFLTEF